VKLFWIILAGACIMVAAFFMLRQDLDKAFVIAALGLVAWFLNYRAQMKEIIAAAELQENSNRNEEESNEDSDHN
jgi:hypothetical protein